MKLSDPNRHIRERFRTLLVELFDVRGRKVATAFEGALAARTAQEIMLDGSALTPGVYVLRTTGETFAETRRVTVVR